MTTTKQKLLWLLIPLGVIALAAACWLWLPPWINGPQSAQPQIENNLPK